ncbi:MAG TPA: heavy-metal-associated domain-containing protein [Micromonosporaceae bacterium]|nr:heavy-metal-associated domain-containing protein [Micromonosporaceae bacterium]
MDHEVTVAVPAGLCRRCVRLLSRRVSDLPGVISLRVEPDRGRLSVSGDVRAAVVMAARDAAGYAVPAASPGSTPKTCR